jgi:hypothetical protein
MLGHIGGVPQAISPRPPSRHIGQADTLRDRTTAFGAAEDTPRDGRSSMEKKNQPVRIELTDEQRNQIREATGKDANAIEFSAEELEERVAPISLPGKFDGR